MHLAVSLTLHSVLLRGDPTFDDWASDMGKVYSTPALRAEAEDNYRTNLAIIKRNRAASPTASYHVSEVMDLPARAGTGASGPTPRTELIDFTPEQLADAGPIDWVAKGGVTTPTSQGMVLLPVAPPPLGIRQCSTPRQGVFFRTPVRETRRSRLRFRIRLLGVIGMNRCRRSQPHQ